LNSKYNILICPLEWGLGHAGRMIPLAGMLAGRNNNVLIGAGKEHQALFRSELPHLKCIDFPGFRPAYSRYLPQYIPLLLQTPLLLYHIVAEHIRLKRIIRLHEIDIVISDNRFGLWNKKIRSVYITHQPLIPFPGKLRSLEWTGVLFHRFFIKKYSLCLIPDLPGDLNLSGRLSHNVRLPGNTRFAGIFSRFTGASAPPGEKIRSGYVTLILSGPEPQREIFRQKVIEILKERELTLVILEGNPAGTSTAATAGNIISYNHLPAKDMQRILSESDAIIARPGYSTIMELISLNKTALLVPTPGQSEQEYLAEYLSSKGWFTTVLQKKLGYELNLPQENSEWTQEIADESRKLLEKALDELLNQ
jgi:spore coat polysaccharide biosynthesis predicted glycosyltransferase SpsG